ncbi:MAG: TIGR04255 family protein [Blastocatellia bacterium]
MFGFLFEDREGNKVLKDANYKYPSLIETVCELRFSSPTKWNMSSFIKFASLAEKAGFPVVVDAGEGFQFDFAVTAGKAQPPKMKPVLGRIQTWNQEKTELWQAGPELFAANRRSPYKGWEVFRPHILNGFELYLRIAKPKKASSMVLTYINRIEFNPLKEKPSKFVRFLTDEIEFADKMINYGRHSEQVYKDGDRIVIIAGKNMQAGSSDDSIILNISYTTLEPKLEIVAFKKHLEKAHSRIIAAFEKSITDVHRKRMEPND